MNILITGAAGFIGSHLTDALLARGHRVVGVDDFSHGSPSNLEEARRSSLFTLLHGDVRDAGTVARAARGAGAIIHLATGKIPRHGNRLETVSINLQGTLNVFAAARKRGRRIKVVLASTSDIYGKNPRLPFNEESDSVLGPSAVPRWSYAATKIAEEHIGYAAAEAAGVRTVILRYFGGYGPRHNLTWWGGPQSVFIDAALRGSPMLIHGTGRQTRTFTYISDLVDGTVRALESPRADGQAFNLGADREISILGLARLIHRLCGRRGKPKLRIVSHEKLFGRYEEVMRRVPDCRKAAHLLGFRARVPLEEGLARTIAWQRGLRGR